MSLGDFAKATFWGAVVIFAIITFYFWFLAEDKSFWIGLGSLGFMLFIAWLGLKMGGRR
jgi:hypothetical protein